MSDDLIKARKKAMDLLARREHGSVELARKLEKAGFDGDVAIDAIGKLTAEGLQSDQRFVEAFVQSRISQGKGPVRILAELVERSIPAGQVDAVLEETEQDWYALAREIRRKKFGSEQPADFKEKARQMRFLQYRGFEADQIKLAVSAYAE
jgi:regulatory protein